MYSTKAKTGEKKHRNSESIFPLNIDFAERYDTMDLGILIW